MKAGQELPIAVLEMGKMKGETKEAHHEQSIAGGGCVCGEMTGAAKRRQVLHHN